MRYMIAAISEPHECTVLFADIAGSTPLYARVGDAAAFQLIESCLKIVRREIEGQGGRVVKHTGDGMLAVFTDPNIASEAVIRIHNAVSESDASTHKLAVRIAFHSGPVIQSADDVFGDTVNVAARLLELASPGRAITSAEAIRLLRPEWRALTHPIHSRSLRGVARLTELFELHCESPGELTIVQSINLDAADTPELRLDLAERSLILSMQKPSARLGRDPLSDLRVTDTRASRNHASIELRGEKFVLVDRSSNGTFVAIEGEKEFVLSHEEIVLRKRGSLALGRPCGESGQLIHFVCL